MVRSRWRDVFVDLTFRGQRSEDELPQRERGEKVVISIDGKLY